jgi:hypothetical protein
MAHKHLYLIYIVGPFENAAIIEDLSFREGNGDFVSYSKQEAYYYAYTFSKKMLKKFMYYRNENRFVVKEKDIRDYTKEELEDFESRNRMYEITVDGIATPSYNFPGMGGNDHGDIEIKIPIPPHEHQIIDNTLEYYDDMIVDKYPKEMIRTMSILIKCAKKEFREALVTAGILDLVMYTQLIVFGESSVEPSVVIDEVAIFFEYYQELFRMDRVYSSIYETEERT